MFPIYNTILGCFPVPEILPSNKKYLVEEPQLVHLLIAGTTGRSLNSTALDLVQIVNVDGNNGNKPMIYDVMETLYLTLQITNT